MAADDLFVRAETLLEACVTILADRAPATAFVSPAEPIWDCCPMLAVHVPSFGEASTLAGTGALSTGHRTTVGRVNLATFNISLVHCDSEVAANTLPDVAAKEQVSLDLYSDAWTLWCGLYRMTSDGTLFTDCGERFLDSARGFDSQGGCIGYRIALRVNVPGYNPLEPSS